MSSTVTTNIFSIVSVYDPCLPLTFEIWDISSNAEIAYDTGIFAVDLVNDPQTL